MGTLISLSPYLVFIYALYALVQSIRHQRQGIKALLLALIVVAVPVVLYLTSSDFLARINMMSAMAASAALMCVIGIVVLFIERRDPKRDKQRSYGILGIGVGLLMAVAIVGGTMTQSISPSQLAGFGNTSGSNGALLNISAPSVGTTVGQGSVPASTAAAVAAQTLISQTGLSAADLTAKIKNGNTIAQLVTAHNGDITAVKKAIAAVFDELKAAGGMQAKMMSSLGSDSLDIASKLVEGQLPAQIQQLVTTQMVSGNAAPPQGAAGFAPPSGANTNASEASSPAAAAPPTASGGFVSASSNNQTQAQAPATATPTTVPTLAPTEVVARPTLIIFPSSTPTTAASTSSGAATASTATVASIENSQATCTIVIDYNLNLRDKPTQEDSTVFLSIPFGTTVTTNGRNADNWYKVTYEGKTGWVSGDYVTAQASCNQLANISG
ncbi:MAG: SH3 domain-containing protein [Anaerolineaceae bacterium]|nr:SH3 domain-containing protein [Anaerolineaceae bacterium]